MVPEFQLLHHPATHSVVVTLPKPSWVSSLLIPKPEFSFPVQNHHSSLFRPSSATYVCICVYILYVYSSYLPFKSLKTEVCFIRFLFPPKPLFPNIYSHIQKAPFYFKYKHIFPCKVVIWTVLEYPHSSYALSGMGCGRRSQNGKTPWSRAWSVRANCR